MCCGEVDIGVSLSGVLLACLPACLLVTGIPLLYLALLFASRAKIRARDVSANVVNMLCQDYTVAYWCVETISHCITSHHTTPHHITPDAQCWWCGGSDIILYYILCGVAVCCTVCPSFVLRLSVCLPSVHCRYFEVVDTIYRVSVTVSLHSLRMSTLHPVIIILIPSQNTVTVTVTVKLTGHGSDDRRCALQHLEHEGGGVL